MRLMTIMIIINYNIIQGDLAQLPDKHPRVQMSWHNKPMDC